MFSYSYCVVGFSSKYVPYIFLCLFSLLFFARFTSSFSLFSSFSSFSFKLDIGFLLFLRNKISIPAHMIVLVRIPHRSDMVGILFYVSFSV